VSASPALSAPPRAAAIYLHPGQAFVSAEPAVLSTILGSCVAVCLWDSSLRAGGMNHFLLPTPMGPEPDAPRFGSAAVPLLLERMYALGARRSTLQAKVFGGAWLSDAFQGGDDHLGRRNADIALRLLRAEGIAVVAEDLGGRRGRKVLFDTHEGTAWVRLVGERRGD
jgi:chemotaxis protein CheD